MVGRCPGRAGSLPWENIQQSRKEQLIGNISCYAKSDIGPAPQAVTKAAKWNNIQDVSAMQLAA